MSDVLKTEYKHSESVRSERNRTSLFGLICEGQRLYQTHIKRRFRLTMAVLDPTSSCPGLINKYVVVKVSQNGTYYLLCVLKHEELHQVNLNLVFNEGEEIKFLVEGYGMVCLTGYYISDLRDEDLNEEVKQHEVSMNSVKMDAETEIPKSKKKVKAEKKAMKKDATAMCLDDYMNENEDDEDDDDSESYSAFCNAEESSEESESSYDEEAANEIDEEELHDLQVEDPTAFQAMGSQKRKHEKTSQPQKRKRNDSFDTSGSMENSEDVICVSDDESDSDDKDDKTNSSIGNTPMPKKQVPAEAASNEKKKLKKKKKKITEISTIAEQPTDGQELKSPTAKSTPNKQKGKDRKYPIVQLDGGVEIQDVLIGRGPVATKGKMIHAFYLGRLEDKQIFDARLAPKKPFSFKLGSQKVIKGFDIGLEGMKVGGQRKLKIPPNMGYGDSARPGIPPNSTLYFTVELQAVN